MSQAHADRTPWNAATLPIPSILVIDDTREFAFDAAYARDVRSAISLLDDEWNEVWVDHDLGNGATTRPVVAWIVEQINAGAKPVIGNICIHSSNPSGAAWIRDQLAAHYPARLVDHAERWQLRRTI